MPVSRAYQSSESVSRRRRSQPATSVAKAGAPSPIRMAAAVMSWPAWGIDTFSEALMSLSVPGTTMTPVPITKLPSIRAHRARGRAVWAGGGVMGVCGGRGRRSIDAIAPDPRGSESPGEHPDQGDGHGQVARELAHRHPGQARPERQLEPARHGAQRVADAG